MIRKKYTRQTLLGTFLCMIAIVVLSCTNDTIENGQSHEIIKMQLQGGLQEFDDVTTRAVMSLPDGAKILIRFENGACGTGVYSAATQEWEFTQTGGSLTTTSSASCMLYYAPSSEAKNNTSITLGPTSPIYMGNGTYSYSSSMLTIQAFLEPATTRVRFKGDSGTKITLSGLSYYNTIDVSNSSPLSSSTSSISLDVNGEYTEYVYGYFADSNRELELTYDDVTYKRTIGPSKFQNGQSGYMSIPSPTALGNWDNVEIQHEYVDLGLSVMWATCNVGASSPEDYGGYYAWGETETKPTYNWLRYNWCNGFISTMTKYCTSSSYGTVDNKTQLEASDDVAHVKWQGSWRMPTKEELNELCTECTWTWDSAKKGYKLISKKNGNSIFIPAAGYYRDGSLKDADSGGYYWSSSLSSGNPNDASNLYFNSSRVSSYCTSEYRFMGYTVRPVCPNTTYIAVSSVTLNQTNLFNVIGSTSQLSATISPSNATNKSVMWSSSNPDVATVSSYGLVTAKGAGSATITATAADDSGVKAICSVTVTTGSSGNGTDNGHGYIDLGLSVKWATCNVGASSPEDYGDYYAWGETKTKSFYDWSTYKWYKGSGATTVTKYCTYSGYGMIDNESQLEASDDVAYVKWKGNWRMPTVAELTELTEQCNWTWTTQGGKDGYKITSKKNGNTIFLPAAGYRHYDSSYDTGKKGYFWSSSLETNHPDHAWIVYFYSDYIRNRCAWYRDYGLTVRPVCP